MLPRCTVVSGDFQVPNFRKVRVVTRKVGVATPKVGVVTPKVGVMTLKVRVVTPKVRVVTPKVGVVTLKVGVVTLKVGVVTPKIGVATPKVRVMCMENHEPVRAHIPEKRSFDPMNSRQIKEIRNKSNNRSGEIWRFYVPKEKFFRYLQNKKLPEVIESAI
jgi:hypothetical protein